jgi:hypothetical protein
MSAVVELVKSTLTLPKGDGKPLRAAFGVSNVNVTTSAEAAQAKDNAMADAAAAANMDLFMLDSPILLKPLRENRRRRAAADERQFLSPSYAVRAVSKDRVGG